MYDISQLYQPSTIQETLDLMQEHKEARILAGGSDLLVKLREGNIAGIECISIFKIDQLRGIELTPDGTIIIRPLTSFSKIQANNIINKYIPVLSEAVGTIGGPQIRNIGTIGGNICNGVTSADSASTLFALDAIVEITHENSKQELPIAEFYISSGKVALNNGLLTAIKIPKSSYKNCHGAYIKYAMRNAMDIATLGCSVNLCLSENKEIIENLRIAYGVAAPTPVRCKNAESAVVGKPLTQQTAEILADMALKEISPRTSWRATKELRLQIAYEIAIRAFKQAAERAGGLVL